MENSGFLVCVRLGVAELQQRGEAEPTRVALVSACHVRQARKATRLSISVASMSTS